MNKEVFNLNVRYDFPVWEYRVPVIYSMTRGWIEGTNYWFNQEIDKKHICASLEPAGLSFSAQLEEGELQAWKLQIKRIATAILGYQIGELELGEVGEIDWIDPGMQVLEEFASFHYQKNNPQSAWKFYDLNTEKLSELDILEQMKIMFRMQWHTLHDNLASDFQSMRHPSTATFLYDMVKGSEIPELDYKPVSRKCIWALADIGTTSAKNYLTEISTSKDDIIAGFAARRLARWEEELHRKGRYIFSDFRRGIKLEKYKLAASKLPVKGKNIVCFQTEKEVVVYQAYKPAIAKYCVEQQKLGGPGFSYERMSWIKPGFLWMMYRSGWAQKENQERILAISIKKSDLDTILSKAVLSSYDAELYASHEEWKTKLNNSEVRVQWDPDHDPHGNKQDRKAIQIGLKGQILYQFGHQMIQKITDITPYVAKQRIYVEHQQLDKLEIPDESIYAPPSELNQIIGIQARQ